MSLRSPGSLLRVWFWVPQQVLVVCGLCQTSARGSLLVGWVLSQGQLLCHLCLWCDFSPSLTSPPHSSAVQYRLLNLMKNKNKTSYPLCTSHISGSEQPHVTRGCCMLSIDWEHSHRHISFYWLALPHHSFRARQTWAQHALPTYWQSQLGVT